MSSAMDKALMELSLDDEDVPFVMPDLPEFSSMERNRRSLIGRLLNPPCQNMASLIHDMPRKWQKYGRVRGIALSKERFQFIFQNEYDLEDVLSKGIHTYNEWALAIERWIEHPPPDYLQFVLLWVQISNIPVNYYTTEAITALGDLVGKVETVAFDPEKPHTREYVRVQVRFNVANPLRKSRVISLKKGGSFEVFYFYERVQKRCYHCQRMTHEKPMCLLLVRQRQDQTIKKRLGIFDDKPKPNLILSENDPLYGVLEEHQVGIHPVLGRPKIASEVLEGMRQYLMVAEGEERKIREERVRKSVREVELNPVSERMVLRLEEPPVITKDLNRGKGILFEYDAPESNQSISSSRTGGQKLMGAAIVAGRGSTFIENPRLVNYSSESNFSNSGFSISDNSSTAYNIGLFEGASSGTVKKQGKPRRRPYVKKRKLKPMEEAEKVDPSAVIVEKPSTSAEKRKSMENAENKEKAVRQKTKGMVPNEGPSKSQ
ncbi:hypothetical protein Bca101_068903 [Brassica carinata]